MPDDHIDVGLASRIRVGRIGLIVVGLVAIPAAVSFLTDPPRGGWFGTSRFIPRAIAIVALPAVLYMIVALVWSLVRRGPELILDSRGVMVATLFRKRWARWDEIDRFERDTSEESALIVALESGERLKIITKELDGHLNWNTEHKRKELLAAAQLIRIPTDEVVTSAGARTRMSSTLSEEQRVSSGTR
jgi:hypothetical protein